MVLILRPMRTVVLIFAACWSASCQPRLPIAQPAQPSMYFDLTTLPAELGLKEDLHLSESVTLAFAHPNRLAVAGTVRSRIDQHDQWFWALLDLKTGKRIRAEVLPARPQIQPLRNGGLLILVGQRLLRYSADMILAAEWTVPRSEIRPVDSGVYNSWKFQSTRDESRVLMVQLIQNMREPELDETNLLSLDAARLSPMGSPRKRSGELMTGIMLTNEALVYAGRYDPRVPATPFVESIEDGSRHPLCSDCAGGARLALVRADRVFVATKPGASYLLADVNRGITCRGTETLDGTYRVAEAAGSPVSDRVAFTVVGPLGSATRVVVYDSGTCSVVYRADIPNKPEEVLRGNTVAVGYFSPKIALSSDGLTMALSTAAHVSVFTLGSSDAGR